MKNNNKKLIAKIIPAVKLPTGMTQVFSYGVPEKFAKKIKIGMIVKISFRNKIILGAVLDIKKEDLEKIKYKLKNVEDLSDENINLSEEQLKLAKFISEYYYTPLSLVVKTMIPPMVKKAARKNIELNHAKINLFNRKILQQTQDDILKKMRLKKKILFIHNLQAERHNLYFNIIKSIVRQAHHDIKQTRHDIKNEQVLILLPEYFDVYNFANFYITNFKNSVAVLTSELTKNQYYGEWQKIKNGSAQIIIGTRQAVFAPFQNLKLIIADDEHNSSYKQWDMNPRYHGIKAAEKLAEIWQAKIILSSPTPSVENYYEMGDKINICHCEEPTVCSQTVGDEAIPELNSSRVASGLLRLWARNDRNINLIDINAERQRGNYSVLSEDLKNSLLENIYKRKQAIIFIPRLGNNTITQCKDCGWIAECKNCQTALVSYANYLYCPRCREKIDLIKKCPRCQGQNINSFGYGSEKIEQEIKDLFQNKNIKISRLDSETALNKSIQSKIYKDFITGKVDILIGTQMVLKNWNLEKLALTAILFPEIIFHQSDFRTKEKSFQFLMSLRNRASENHQVIIQTHKPDNDLFKLVILSLSKDIMVRQAHHDTKINSNILKFYSDEIENRKAISKTSIGYPPFAQLIKLIYKDFNSQNCKDEAEIMFRALDSKIKNDKNLKNKFEIIKPFPASSYKEFNKYRWHIIIKSICADIELRNSLLNLVKKNWIINIDPDGVI